MLAIAWRVLRRRPGTLLGACTMITVGAALLSAFMLVQNSIAETRAPVERYASADVVGSGQSGVIPGQVIEQAADIPGVHDVVPEVSFPALVFDADGSLPDDWQEPARLGHNWSSSALASFELREGESPSGPGEVVMDPDSAAEAGAEVGDTVTVEAGGLAREYHLAGVAEPEAQPLQQQRAVYFDDTEAHELAERDDDRADALGLFLGPEADAERVAAELDEQMEAALTGDVASPSEVSSYQVAHGPERGELEETLPDHAASAQAIAMMVWIVAFMAIVVIAGALTTAVRNRSHQFALLRAVGATPRQVRLLCLAESFLVSVAGAAVGVLAGTGLAWVLLEVSRAIGIVSPVLSLHLTPDAFLVAAGTTVAVGQVSAWLASRAALRIRPAEALSDPMLTPAGRGRRGLAPVLGGILLASASIVQMLGMAGLMPPGLLAASGMVASGLIISGLSLLASWVIRGIIRPARPPLSAVSPASGYLAAANVWFHSRRYASAAVPAAVGTAIAGWTLAGMPLFALDNAEDQAERFTADHVIHTPIVRDAHTGLGEELRSQVQNTPAVHTTAALRELWGHAAPQDTTADSAPELPSDGVTRTTIVAGDADQLLNLGAVEGDLTSVAAGEGVAIGASYAEQIGVSLHDDVQVRTSGAADVTELPVTAVFDQDQGGTEGIVVADAALEEAPGDWYDYVLVDATNEEQAAQALAGVLPTNGTAMGEDHDAFLQNYVEQRIDTTDHLGTVAMALVGAFLMLASVNALALSVTDRAPELSSLRRLGLSPARLRGMVSWEMALTIGPAWLLGAAATVWMALAMAGGSVGAAMWGYPVGTIALFGLGGLVTAVLGALASSRTALRSGQR